MRTGLISNNALTLEEIFKHPSLARMARLEEFFKCYGTAGFVRITSKIDRAKRTVTDYPFDVVRGAQASYTFPWSRLHMVVMSLAISHRMFSFENSIKFKSVLSSRFRRPTSHFV